MPITNIEPAKKAEMPEKPPKKRPNFVVIILISVVIISIGASIFWFINKTEPQYGALTNENLTNQSDVNATSGGDTTYADDSSVLAGYSNFQNQEFKFTTIYKSRWIAKEYDEEELTDGDFSKIFAFYALGDYQMVSAGKSPDYEGSIFIEIHRPLRKEYQNVKNGITPKVESYTVDNKTGYYDTVNKTVYIEYNNFIYCIILRGEQNIDVFNNMLKYFKFTS